MKKNTNPSMHLSYSLVICFIKIIKQMSIRFDSFRYDAKKVSNHFFSRLSNVIINAYHIDDLKIPFSLEYMGEKIFDYT
jgi:hypothetical protein